MKGVLPDWKQREYGLVLFISILSVYDTNESEVYSMALNDNIKRLREEKDLTQQQLADKIYVSRQTVCRRENSWKKWNRKDCEKREKVLHSYILILKM